MLYIIIGIVVLALVIAVIAFFVLRNANPSEAETVDAALKKAEKITSLNLSEENATKLPPEIEQLEHLETVYIANNNSFTALPNEICKLKNISEINVNHTGLTALPNDIGNLKKLTSLHLGQNHLNQVPLSIEKLLHLKVFSVPSNFFSAVPLVVCELVNLQELDFQENKLGTLPVSISKLVNLKTLRLAANQITHLPEEIGKLTKIETLDISANPDLKGLPNGLANLQQLKNLDVNRCEGMDWDQAGGIIGKLKNLEEIRADHAGLKRLPESWGKLPKLTKISLQRNDDMDWDQAIDTLAKMPSLREVTILDLDPGEPTLKKLRDRLPKLYID